MPTKDQIVGKKPPHSRSLFPSSSPDCTQRSSMLIDVIIAAWSKRMSLPNDPNRHLDILR